MQASPSSRPRSLAAPLDHVVGWSAVVCAVLQACAPAASTPAAGTPERKAFGGERAAFGDAQGVRAVDENAGRCQNVPALTTDALLADFEQDSVFLRPVPERYGVWYLSNDGSPEGKQSPESYAAERGGYAGSNYALHYRAEGFSEWGAVAGFQIRYAPSEGIRCPFNASAFQGLSFMARGQGRIRLELGTPETMPSDNEGRCQRGCWDGHGAFVFLTEEWKEHRVPWSAFSQQGWGTASRLNLSELLAVNFEIGRADQPAELWLDDVRFLTAGAGAVTPPPAANPAAAN